MGDADRGVGRVHALAARAGGGRGFDVEVLRPQLDLDGVGLRQHSHRRRRGVDASLRLRLRHALDAVDAALVLQLRVRALTVDLELDLVVPAHAGGRGVHDLDLPALLLGPARVHPEQVRREERRLIPTLGALDLDDDVAVVVRVLGQEENLQPLLELLDLLRGATLLRAHVLLHRGIFLVPQHLAG